MIGLILGTKALTVTPNRLRLHFCFNGVWHVDRLCVWTWLELLLNTGADGVDEQQQQAQASTSGAGTDRDAFRDAVSIELCFQALHSSCLLPFLDRQLGSASFNDMASRQAATRATTNACRHTYRFTETKRND